MSWTKSPWEHKQAASGPFGRTTFVHLPGHWAALRRAGSQLWFIDSLAEGPILLATADDPSTQAALRAYPAVYAHLEPYHPSQTEPVRYRRRRYPEACERLKQCSRELGRCRRVSRERRRRPAGCKGASWMAAATVRARSSLGLRLRYRLWVTQHEQMMSTGDTATLARALGASESFLAIGLGHRAGERDSRGSTRG